MSHTKFASSFAPYTPPPDDPSYVAATPARSRPSTQRAWFPSQHVVSYQSGGVPTFDTSQAGGAGTTETLEAAEGVAAWETRYGFRVDLLGAFAYILGPVSALAILILETHNDYVRFHGYQSALLSTPLLGLYIIISFITISVFFQTVFLLLLVGPLIYMAWQGYAGAARYGLTRFYVPWIGPIADRWVSEE
ncbi:hypothetical protein BDY19DRAFT_915197 [Irpex rosettiformis]|uniref:Uncharacterized protein n=1 Tax=Irpex rosettiformis TaxID=378272 RepID=A0ACB8UKI2_9APHY|nr:hypothetical protein BDY19DRAFT_915197 [Irpex rosettiformis]